MLPGIAKPTGMQPEACFSDRPPWIRNAIARSLDLSPSNHTKNLFVIGPQHCLHAAWFDRETTATTSVPAISGNGDIVNLIKGYMKERFHTVARLFIKS